MDPETRRLFAAYKKENQIKIPLPGFDRKPNRDYCLRQVAHIEQLLSRDSKFADALSAIKNQWGELAGPPPFNFGAFCRQYKIVNPAYDVARSKEEAVEQVNSLKAALKAQDLPHKIKGQIRQWLTIWQERARVFDYEFGTTVVRKGASPQERARKERVRQRSVEEYNNRMKRK